MTRRRVLIGTASLMLVVTACRENSGGTGSDENRPSPNASILPAPLASGANLERKHPRPDAGWGGIPADSAGRLLLPDAAPPAPTPYTEHAALARDTLTTRDGIGVTLDARFVWRDIPPPAAGPEVSADALNEAKRALEPKLTIDLAPAGRMRLEIASPVFPLPRGTELRANTAHFGHVLVWPDGHAYRVALPGTLRALFAERRMDATPLTTPSAKPKGKGGALGVETRKVQLVTESGTLDLELGQVAGLGDAGKLLCRFLVELVAVEPNHPICDGPVPLRADYRWPKGGGLGFEVTAIARRQDLPIGNLFVPPAAAMVKPGELPPQQDGVLLTRAQLAAIRTKAAPRAEPAPADAPGEGLLAVNHENTLRYVLIDGLPAAWIRPKTEQYLIGPQPGRYVISFRDFFGASVQPPKTVVLPARVEVGAPTDGGAP